MISKKKISRQRIKSQDPSFPYFSSVRHWSSLNGKQDEMMVLFLLANRGRVARGAMRRPPKQAPTRQRPLRDMYCTHNNTFIDEKSIPFSGGGRGTLHRRGLMCSHFQATGTLISGVRPGWFLRVSSSFLGGVLNFYVRSFSFIF